jgi:hypothetical protein
MASVRSRTAKVVEHWNQYAKIRQDLFGVDILALKPGEPVLVGQATTGSNHAVRRTKLDGEGFTALWEGAGAQLEVWCTAPLNVWAVC